VDVILIGYENQENLGLRSIMAQLLAQGMQAVLIPFSPGGEFNEDILAAIRRFQPRLVGFSIIFQYTIVEFGRLIDYLREQNVTAHFTGGGHFPSLCPEATLQEIPGLDSIVRFEGEITILELLRTLDRPEDWESIPGLAFRKGSRIVLNELRPLIPDLNALAPVYRDADMPSLYGVKTAAMIASRGCLYNCSFCSIRKFYGSSPGSLRRTRLPGAVVGEMRSLYANQGVEFFSFQDDDFAAHTKQQRAWLQEFLQELEASGLASRVCWKISCRVDDVDPDLLGKMRDHGLAAVYLGVESGNKQGLRMLNKNVTVERNAQAIALIKQFHLALSIGFMLFDPSSTFESIRENVHFLAQAGGDGYFPINFCKMLPYAGTPIEAELRAQGRLTGSLTQPNYRFLDEELDVFEFLVQQIFTRRNFSDSGLVVQLQNADFNWRLHDSMNRSASNSQKLKALASITAASNLLLTRTLEELLDLLISQGRAELLAKPEILVALSEKEWRGEMQAELDLHRLLTEADGIGAPQHI
jgi:anaerobic magnesium-protoporphyrin IX monomethyl ester cyclase